MNRVEKLREKFFDQVSQLASHAKQVDVGSLPSLELNFRKEMNKPRLDVAL